MVRRRELAVAWMCMAGACQDPLVLDEPDDTSTSSTPGTSTAVDPTTGDPTTGDPTTGGGTTTSLDGSTTTDGTTGGTTEGFIFDVGGGMATGNIPDLPPVLDYDCEDLTQPFVSEMELGAPRGYHDLVFDDQGRIIGSDGGSLLAVTYDDVVEVFLPGPPSGVQGMDVLENGDVVVVTNSGELRRITDTQQNTLIASGFSGAYGVTVGPDEMVYVCTPSAISRVDPDSGDQEIWLSTPSQHPRAMVFNLDSTGVYFSTLVFGNSPVYFVEVDEDLDPVGAPVVFATNVGQGYHDGLGIDACGNLYVPDFNTAGLYRIDPSGVVTTLYNEGTAPFNHYGHGLEWGSGIDGWNDHAIYLPQPYDGNTVNEVVLGVPSGSEVRTWRGQ